MAVSGSDPIVRRAGGRKQLAWDARIAFIMLNEARYRGMASLFGCSRDQANIATFLLALTFAEATRARLARLMRPSPPQAGDALIFTGSVQGLLSAAAGRPLDDNPQLGTLLLLGVIAGGAAPSIIRSLNGMRGFSQELNRRFRHRYGYLVDPGHVRREHYERHGRGASTDTPLGDAGH